MRTATDVIRTLLASIVGAAVIAATLYGISTYYDLSWLDPLAIYARIARTSHGQYVATLVGLALLPISIAAAYASWFDGLLRGNALLRGLKFGAILGFWTALGAAFVYSTGFSFHGSRVLFTAIAILSSAFAFGAVLGVVYGAGRRYDDYRFGLGYGLPDRRSIA